MHLRSALLAIVTGISAVACVQNTYVIGGAGQGNGASSTDAGGTSGTGGDDTGGTNAGNVGGTSDGNETGGDETGGADTDSVDAGSVGGTLGSADGGDLDTGGAAAGGAAAGGRQTGGNGGASGGAETGGAGGFPTGDGGSGGAAAFALSSTAIADGAVFPDEHTCAGANVSPPLEWTEGPAGTLSYAVVLLDTNNNLSHWVLWDIPSAVTSLDAALPSGAMPETPDGAKQRSTQNSDRYAGPCPLALHTYRFTVYALPVETLPGDPMTVGAVVSAIEDAGALGEASFEGESDGK